MKIPRHIVRFFIIMSGLCLLDACASRLQITRYPTGQEQLLPNRVNYCWAEGKAEDAMSCLAPAGGHHTVFDTAIRASINEALEEKGYQSSPSCATAEFMIDYRMGIHTDVASADVSEEDSLHDYGPKWSIGQQADIRYEGLARPEEVLITVQHGTLHIAAFTAEGQLLWHSSAEKVLSDRESDTTRLKAIRQATDKVMASFPVRHPSSSDH